MLSIQSKGFFIPSPYLVSWVIFTHWFRSFSPHLKVDFVTLVLGRVLPDKVQVSIYIQVESCSSYADTVRTHERMSYLSFGPGREVRGWGELTGCADCDHWETCSRLDDSGLAAIELRDEFWAWRRNGSCWWQINMPSPSCNRNAGSTLSPLTSYLVFAKNEQIWQQKAPHLGSKFEPARRTQLLRRHLNG